MIQCERKTCKHHNQNWIWGGICSSRSYGSEGNNIKISKSGTCLTYEKKLKAKKEGK